MTLASAAFAAARARCRTPRDPRRAAAGGSGRRSAWLAAGSLVSPCVAGARARPCSPWVGIPVGAYVCAEAETVQRVRAALLDSGRLKPHGVTRFDARVWRALDEDGHLPIPTDPDAAEWAVHVFGLPPADPRTTPSPPSSTPARSVTSPAFASAPPRVTSTSTTSAPTATATATPVGDRTTHPPHPPVPSASSSPPRRPRNPPRSLPAASTPSARARPGGRVQPPKWAPPDDHPTFARFTFSELFAGVGVSALRSATSAARRRSRPSRVPTRDERTSSITGAARGRARPGMDPWSLGISRTCARRSSRRTTCSPAGSVPIVQRRGQRWGLDDPRGALYREILRTLVACRPRAFLLENVEGLATMDDGEVLDVIVADLRAAGYDVETKIIDAAGWVPQSEGECFRRLQRRRGRRRKRSATVDDDGGLARRAQIWVERDESVSLADADADARRDGEGRVGG